MKSAKVFSVILLVLGLFIITNIVINRPVQASQLCGLPVLEGCIGACGAPYLESYVVLEKGEYCFTTTGSSLCPNTGAEAAIYRNEKLKFKGEITNGVFLVIGAEKGDIII